MLLANAPYSTSDALLGFAAQPQPSVSALARASRPYTPVPFGASLCGFGSVLQASPGAPSGAQAVLDAPGVLQLQGVRYMTLRVREFDDVLTAPGKNGGVSSGVGVFKLADAASVAQLRFDFVSTVRRPLHPIGRLSRLTLRFELLDGSLYDFKGADHQILLSVRFYAPAPRRGAIGAAGAGPPSVLNPDYTPDFLRWQLAQLRDAAVDGRDRGYEAAEDYDDDDGAADSQDGGDTGGGARGPDDSDGSHDDDASVEWGARQVGARAAWDYIDHRMPRRGGGGG